MTGPLAGKRVLSMAEQYPGPYCTMLLADMGAEVILIERPGRGDPARNSWLGRSLGRNKKSITLDLKRQEARTVVYRLAPTAHAFVEGFRPGVVAALGVDYETLRWHNPALVYCSISGYGQDGPYRTKPGHDLSYQALSGLLANLIPAGDFEHRPSAAIADLSSGMFAAIAILAGLVHAAGTGEGQYVDVSMTDGLVSWMTSALTALINTEGPARPNDRRPGYGVFRCRDGFFTLSIAGEEHFWQNLCRALGRPDFADLPRAERSRRVDEIHAAFAEAFADRTRAELDALMIEADVPAGPVLSLEEVLVHPQIASRDLVATARAAGGEEVRHIESPIKFSATPVAVESAAPALGEHTHAVLRELGYTDTEIEALRRSGAV